LLRHQQEHQPFQRRLREAAQVLHVDLRRRKVHIDALAQHRLLQFL
jgi:hypothetical protein